MYSKQAVCIQEKTIFVTILIYVWTLLVKPVITRTLLVNLQRIFLASLCQNSDTVIINLHMWYNVIKFV